MGMVVRSNLMAANAQRQLNNNNSQVSKDLEKLSSGFKINRAADNAAGLAISEKMKAQIKGLETAAVNAQDGISLVQVAEGALSEVHDMLDRMVELAEKSANGTLETPSGTITMTSAGTDRRALQDEMDAMSLEIDRIADSTNFNNIMLLNGLLSASGAGGAGGSELTVDSDALAAVGISGCESINPADAGDVTIVNKTNTPAASTLAGQNLMGQTDVAFTTTAATGGILDQYAIKLVAGGANEVDFDADGTMIVTVDASGGITDYPALQTAVRAAGTALAAAANEAADLYAIADALMNISIASAGGGTPTVGGIPAGTTGDLLTVAQGGFTGGTAANEITIDDGGDVTTFYLTDSSVAAGNILDTGDLALTIGDETLLLATTAETTIGSYTAAAGGGTGGLQLQIGDTYDSFNRMMVVIDDMHMDKLFDVSTLGSASLVAISTGGGTTTAYVLDISSQDKAGHSLDAIRNAINKVSTQRAKLGATQNRLEHTISNLEVGAENMNQANSRIRDTDMAWQMMDYTKMNVLTQAAQAMLAQANQQPQAVLQLLQ